MDLFEVEFFMKHHVFMEWTPFIGENYNAKERKQMSKNPFAIVIVERTAGCT